MEKGAAIFIIAVIVIALIGGVVWIKSMAKQTANTEKPTGNVNTASTPTAETGTKVLLETNYGNITLLLRADMPITSRNFINLVKNGTYNGVIFHRVIAGFMIQGGDPTGTGYGDRSIPMIPDEFLGEQKNDRGTIAMANAGPNTGSSQFFINLVNNNFLDGKHPVFGKVIEGMDVVDKIAKVETDANGRPLSPVTITGAKVL